MRLRSFLRPLIWVVMANAVAVPATAQQEKSDAVVPGELIVEQPTLISLGFEWHMAGDANRNAKVTVAFRKKGASAWRKGLPFLRVQTERTVLPGTLDYTAPHMFAGSLFMLAPDTEYEARFALSDPDGVMGEAERSVTVRTRAEPQPAGDGRTFHVYPAGYEGPRQEPAFTGLLAAYYTAAMTGDWSRASPPRVKPGDTILVHAGTYRHNRFDYAASPVPWDGTYYLSQDGTPKRPIAIKAAGDGDVVFDGNGNHVLFNVMGADYTYFEGIIFRNTDLAIEAGKKHIAGARGLTVKHSRFEDVGAAVHSDYSGSRNFYIADNVMVGRFDPDRLSGWYAIPPWNELPDFDQTRLLKSYYAVKVYGAGHVVAYNRISGFHDGIDHATYGMPDDYPNTPRDRMPVSIDIHNNDVSNIHDNCFEADGAMHNIRVFDNRCFNVAVGAMSPQPVFGGPVYFIRNVVYNSVFGPLKIHGNPSGIMVLQNTFIGEVSQITPASNMHFRNNLILGQGARPAVFAIDTLTNYSSSDYNGFYPNEKSEYAFAWNSPPEGRAADFSGELVERRFATFADYRAATGQDSHSRLIDYGIFRSAASPDLDKPTRIYSPEDVDLRLKEGSAAVDAGTVLPDITDGYKGSAPDLGAYEHGQPLPHYGPRAKASAKGGHPVDTKH